MGANTPFDLQLFQRNWNKIHTKAVILIKKNIAITNIRIFPYPALSTVQSQNHRLNLKGPQGSFGPTFLGKA